MSITTVVITSLTVGVEVVMAAEGVELVVNTALEVVPLANGADDVVSI